MSLALYDALGAFIMEVGGVHDDAMAARPGHGELSLDGQPARAQFARQALAQGDYRALAGGVAERAGQATAAIEKIVSESLPDGMTYEWTDLTFQEKRVGNTAIYIFALAVLLAFLVYYRDWLPLVVAATAIGARIGPMLVADCCGPSLDAEGVPSPPIHRLATRLPSQREPPE